MKVNGKSRRTWKQEDYTHTVHDTLWGETSGLILSRDSGGVRILFLPALSNSAVANSNE